METRQFAREFKLEAVRLISAQALKDLCVHPTQSRNSRRRLLGEPVGQRLRQCGDGELLLVSDEGRR